MRFTILVHLIAPTRTMHAIAALRPSVPRTSEWKKTPGEVPTS